MSRRPLGREELEALVGGREIGPYLNPRNEEYRARDWARQPPSRAEALDRMADNPNLIRRPLLVVGPEVLFGFDEAAWRRALGR